RERVVDCGTHTTGCHHAGYDERVDIMEREHALERRSEECAGLALHNHRLLGTWGDLGRDLGGFAAGRIVGTAEDAGAGVVPATGFRAIAEGNHPSKEDGDPDWPRGLEEPGNPAQRHLPHLCASEEKAILDERPCHIDDKDSSLSSPTDWVSKVGLPIHGEVSIRDDVRNIGSLPVQLPVGHGCVSSDVSLRQPPAPAAASCASGSPP